ncbi:MAG: LamG domain-containing protein, partial [Planctomycetota bacterium]
GLIGDLHSTVLTDMWLTAVGEPEPAWIQYEFDKDYKLHQMWVWNHNSLLEPSFGLGIKNASIEYSVDGANWTVLGTTHEFARAPGAAGYAADTTIDLSNVLAGHGKITANSNWGGVVLQYGLSEVRFFYVPVLAREPSPVSGATDTNVDAALSWRAGRETAAHDVYLSTDEQAVIDETIDPVASIAADSSYTSYAPLSLDLGKTYYWKINEVNEAETPATWQGEIWNFSTQEYLPVEGFEDFNDYPPDEIYSTWLDGYETPTNGSQVGHLNPPFAEPTIVHSGSQSMPFYYDNSAPSYSEATANVADLVIGADWTKHGIKTLSLWFRGDPNNSAELMYVKLNGSKVVYDGDAVDITQTMWQPWNIELADFGVDLVNVTQLSIGFERSGAVGGTGLVYLDDIRLYPHSRQLLTPVEPSQDGLVGYWTFDEGSGTIASDQSGEGNDGTFQGSPRHLVGKINGALQFDGDDDQIQLTSVFATLGSASNTVTLWVKVPAAGTGALATNERVGIIIGSYPDTPNTNWEIAAQGRTRLYWNGGEFNSYGTTDLRDNIWHHVAWVRDKAAGACYTYIDGRLEATHPATGADVTYATTHSIGGDNRSDPPNFHGLMDDLQIYSRALSHAEIAWLAGRTKPFDQPF